MCKNINKLFLVLCLLFFLFSSMQANLQTGSIKGRIFDEEGNPVTRAIVYLDSSEISSLLFSITPDTGKFRFFSLPTGDYTITVEIPDFKRMIVENVIIQAGKTVDIDIPLKKITTEEGEEETLPYSSPTLDPGSVENISNLEKAGVRTLPFKRQATDVLEALPGVQKIDTAFPQKTYIIHGSSARSSIYALDGAILNSSEDMSLPMNISYDIIEEVAIKSSGRSAGTGNISGGYINVLTKTYGKHPNLEIIAHHTSDNYNSDLRDTEEIEAMGLALPPLDKHLWDVSFSLGGPVYYDKIWMFASSRLNFYKQNTPFFPWTDPLGELHRSYDREDNDLSAIFKLSTNLIPSLNASLSFNFVDLYQPYSASEFKWNMAGDSTHILDHQKSYILNGWLDYKLSEDTFISGQGSYVHTETPLIVQPDSLETPRYFDELTGYRWGSALFNDTYTGKRFQLYALLSHYLVTSKTINAEVQAGISYQYLSDERSTWTENNLLYHFMNSIPYFYGETVSPESGNMVGTGRISLNQARNFASISLPETIVAQYGVFLQNSVTFVKRITINFSLRFDRSAGSMEAFGLPASVDPLSLKIGEELIQPLIDSNPFGESSFSNWSNAIVWNTFSPQAGISIDIFGNGRTLLKASYGRYKDPLLLSQIHALNPYDPDKLLSFIWYDENLDGLADEEDSFGLYPMDYRIFTEQYYRKSVNPDIRPSYTDELSIGIQQELFPNCSLRLTYIQKTTGNIIEDSLYDPDSDQTWYMLGSAPAGWWNEFDTVIPGTDGYPASTVPAYFQSEDAPLLFYRLDNVPELTRKYRGLEITLEKRMAHKWQFFGSIVLSKTSGNIGLGYHASSGTTSIANSPNALVNIPTDARLDYDRPVVIKMMGAYEFPWDIYMSFYYMYTSGTPWARQVTVIPPASWTEPMNAYPTEADLFLEDAGSRRFPSYSTFDIRLEKTFQLKGKGRLSACIDFLNLLGNKYDNILGNDGGYWYPSEENSSEGIRVLNPSYNQIISLIGFQGFRFSLRLGF